MSKVLGGITTSLDGYVTGPNDGPGNGLGDGGERLHYWVFGGPWTYDTPVRGEATGIDRAYLDEGFGSAGALVAGRTMYDASGGWGDDPGFGMPMFVVTHRAHDRIVKGDSSFEFLTDGLQAAVKRARDAAGDRNVLIMGGADVLTQCLGAGLLDELTLSIAPVVLGSGKRLFATEMSPAIELERIEVLESPWVTHLRYRVTGPVS